ALAHWPAQLTTISASTSPWPVRTPVTVLFLVRMPVTRVCSEIATPLSRAPRVGAAVAGQPDRTLQVVVAQDRVELAGPGRADQLAVELVGLGGGGGPFQLGHAVFGAGDGDAAAATEAGAQARLCFQPLVQLAGVLHQPGAVLRGAQLADQAGRVPGGAA